jgi:hypothetical protein
MVFVFLQKESSEENSHGHKRRAERWVALTPAQLSMLLEGIDWRRPVRSYDPQMAV